jgi:hypothetical protein
MSEPKFTPGPWEVDAEDFHEEDGTIGITGNLNCVDGDVIWYSMARVVVMRNDEGYAAGNANADLIAAAPEMYEALKKIRDRAYAEYPVSIGNQNAWAAIAAWAVDAMQKAEGRHD